LISEAVTRGSDLTERLLAFARKQPLQPREIDVNALVMEAARLLRPTLGEQVDVQMILAGDTSRAMIDPSQLTNAILNLALNARDAMPDGGTLIIETSNVVVDETYADMSGDVAAGSYVMVAVSDSGHGIPADILNHVFEPFFTTKDVDKGVRPRPQHGLWLRQAVQWAYQDLQPRRPWHDGENLSAPGDKRRSAGRVGDDFKLCRRR
jgi:signal transduction histidine kinase